MAQQTHMGKPHHRFSIIAGSLLSLTLLLAGTTAETSAQQVSQTVPPGTEPYQTDNDSAIELLRNTVKKHPDDADAWYHLGLAYYKKGFIAEARRNFERLIELRPDSTDANAKLAYAFILADKPEQALRFARRALELGDRSAEVHYAIAEANLRKHADILTDQIAVALQEAETSLRIDPQFTPALITKSFALWQLSRYPESIACLEQFLSDKPGDVDADVWRAQLEQMREKAKRSNQGQLLDDPGTFGAREVTQKARVLSKPEPSYTEAARIAGVEGTVVLRAVFAADGEVKNIFVLQGLSHGFTTTVVNAARKIKFEPALKDGKPVSMRIQLEYNFNLY
jgi:TonB family protein